MKLLHVDSSILGDNSVSRAMSKAVVERLRALYPDLAVTTRDLGASPISHLSGAYLSGQSAEVKHDQAMQDDLAIGGTALDEFLATDILVLGSPMYNFSIPSQLKSWIDRIVIAGKTFRYGAQGAEGLAGGKRVILALSRGGAYSADSPFAAFNFQEPYLKAVFGFIGLPHVETFVAERVAVSPEQRQRALDEALAQIAALGATR